MQEMQESWVQFLGLEDTLAGYNPQGHKELYMTETAEHAGIHTLTYTHTHSHTHTYI